jgi:CRP-like cAMP-binding protein
MTDMLTLRLALVGGYTGLVAFHTLQKKPLRIPLRWSAVFVLVNAGMAAVLIADRWPDSLSEDEERLYEEHFSMLTRGQFKQLVNLGHARVFPSGSRLTEEGVHSDTIYFTSRGHSKMYLGGKYAKDIEEGSFVNDVAFQQEDGSGAYGTVVTDGEVEVVEWNWQELREHLESRPDMDRNMRLCLTSHLMKGLLQQRKAAYSNSEVLGFQGDLPDMAE